jgi:8-amino-3,8-dideoxy-alpha-D-manno-octulosonate transaminase
MTFISTATSVLHVGATPVFADVDPETYDLDPADVARRVTPRTKAIVAVHYGGQAADVDELRAIADGCGALLFEDAAEAHGAAYKGRPVGGLGAASMFSFTPTKNITTGEGGIVLTADEDLYVRAARYHDQGGQFVTQYRGSRGPDRGEPFMGDNLRMTEIAGALGTVQLRRLAPLLDAMRDNCARVRDAVGVIHGFEPRRLPDPDGAGGSSLTWFAPDATVARRAVDALRAEGVPAAQMYEGEPVYANEAVRERRTAADHGGPWHCGEHPTTHTYAPGTCPRTEALVARSVTVAIGPAWEPADCDHVARAVREVAAALV